MIRSFSVKNFKSFNEAEMYLAPLTLLIGPNASGKSNLLEAIRILAWLAKGNRLDDIEKTILGKESLVRGKPSDLFKIVDKGMELGCRMEGMIEDWNQLSIEICLTNEKLIIKNEKVFDESEDVLYQIDDKPSLHTDEIRVMYNNFKRGKNKPHIPCSNRQAIFYQLETPGRFNNDHLKSQEIIPVVTKTIRTALRNVIFLDPHPGAMRDYSYAKDDEMKEDGKNLSSVLYKICQKNGKEEAKLLEFIRSLPEQDITDIRFIETDRNDVMVRLVESFGNEERTMDAPLLSDGTLRVLAIGATLLSAPEGSLVIIEEIDNGVHPSRANNLMDQIRKITDERKLRVLLSSHNPALLDALPDNSLGDVLCCYREPREGDSRIVRLRDLERYPELVALGPLGQLMTKRVLDRFLKDQTTSEGRKQNALEWLNQLKSEAPK